MKKLIELCKCSNSWSSYGGGSRVIKVLASPARTLTSSAPSTHTDSTSLYNRLLPIVNPSVSIVPILDQWVEEGGRIDSDSLRDTVDRLRKSKRYNHCLQLVQWMSEKKVVNPSDVSVKLDLIFKVHGVGPAEAFFDSVPDTSRVLHVYNALLKGYVNAKLLEKAEATMEKMKELGYARSFSYNVMLNLYYQLGNHEKLDLLQHEMEEKGINYSTFNFKYMYNIRLSAYVASSDVEQLEMLLKKMEADPLVTKDWNWYIRAASAYLKAGATEKALKTLKESERFITDKTRAYEVLMSLYASMGKRDEVCRICALNKKIGVFKNTSYFSIIKSLCDVDDLDGAEKILQEYEVEVTKPYRKELISSRRAENDCANLLQEWEWDCGLPNFLITAYCKKGHMEKAELVVKRIIDTGYEPNASTWNRIAFGYLKDNQMDKAVEALKKEILVSERLHTPHVTTLGSCLKYLNRKGDMDAAEKIIRSLWEKGVFTKDYYERLVKEIEKENQGSNASSEMGEASHSLKVEGTISLESIVKVLASPTRTLTSSAPSTHTPSTPTASTSLYHSLLPIVNPRVSIVPILDQWVEQRGRIDPNSLRDTVDRFRKSKRYNHCLQIVQWMSDKKVVNPPPYHVSVQLDLIFKVHGVGPAEAFFDSVPDTSRVWHVYIALLNGYAKAKLLEKAEATMEKMKELGYARSSSYNIMLTLYYQLGNREKLDLLLQEMEEKGINCDKYTYTIRLSAYGAASDVEQIEMLLMKMEADPRVTMDWNAYTCAASAYLKAGATEKAFETLKKSEHFIIGDDKTSAYELMMTIYASMGKRDEVYRIWNLNKKIGKFKNETYLTMMISLCKVDDLDGAEKILQEWEAGLTYFDLRLPNFLVTAYCKKGLMEKAELVVKRLIETGREANGGTWSRISLGYVKDNKIDKAVEALKKILVSKQPQRPNMMTLVPCLKYLNRKGDYDAAAEIMKSFQQKRLITSNNYEILVRVIEKGKPKIYCK